MSSVRQGLGKRLAPVIADRAPGLTSSFVREALTRAIDGVGPLPPAASAAKAQLKEQRGDVDQAIHEVIENHVRYAGAQGFVTNLGGVATATLMVPANVTGLALVQCRMVAGIAHLRHHDLDDPRVRNAILVCLLGEESISELITRKRLPAPPMAIATAPAHDPAMDSMLAGEVATELLGRVAGKRLAGVAGKRIPLVGGLIGAGTDGYATWKIGRYTERELLPRTRR